MCPSEQTWKEDEAPVHRDPITAFDDGSTTLGKAMPCMVSFFYGFLIYFFFLGKFSYIFHVMVHLFDPSIDVLVYFVSSPTQLADAC